MICPECGGDTSVNNTATDADKIYRLRKCKKCGKKLYTIEQAGNSTIVKSKLTERNQTYKKLRKNNSSNRALSYQQVQWAYQKWCDGYSQESIAGALFCSAKTIRRSFKYYGFSKKQKEELDGMDKT